MRAQQTGPTAEPEPASVDEVIAGRITEARKAYGWSQAQLAKALDDSGSRLHDRQAVNRVERGRQPLKAAQLLEVAAVLLVPPVELLIPSDADQVVDSPWGVLPAWQLRFFIDPSGEYIRGVQDRRPIVMEGGRFDHTDGSYDMTPRDDTEDER